MYVDKRKPPPLLKRPYSVPPIQKPTDADDVHNPTSLAPFRVPKLGFLPTPCPELPKYILPSALPVVLNVKIGVPPTTSKSVEGVVVPMPTLPHNVIVPILPQNIFLPI